ncbi:MAG: hypothetical protein WCI47_00395 [bacterium]
MSIVPTKFLSRLSMALIISMMISSCAIGCTPVSPVTPSTTSTTSTTTTIPAPTSWNFSLRVGVSADLVAQYGGIASLTQKINTQISAVNAAYQGLCATPIKWIVNEVYTYSSPFYTERTTASKGSSDFLLLYSEDPNPPAYDHGGWEPNSWSIAIVWAQAIWGGVFSRYGDTSLIHELGHARGAIDSYALVVQSNPINGSTFIPPEGYMLNPYPTALIPRWADGFDDYNRRIICASQGLVYSDDHVVRDSLPGSFSVQTVNASGTALGGAVVTVYPVSWFSETVTPTALMTGSTGSNGFWALPRNPFNPGSFPKWKLEYPNFLVKATVAGKTGYAWLPLTDTGSWFFSHPGEAFQLKVTVA